jgi:2-desacetyl-2-hydroxyethyl bacteriochlorophyllide A dehydrogenase
MQAIWLENQQLTYRAAIQLPKPQSDEALIRLRLAGICGTDLELLRGYYPYTGIPGHEFIGEVVEAPDLTWIGERVVGEINIHCGKCQECQAGRSSHCDSRRVLGVRNYPGVFAEYLTLPLANLHRVPSAISDEAAVFVEPLAAALEIQEQVAIQKNDRVLLVGAGRLGFLIAQTLALIGCDFMVVARQPRMRNLLAKFKIPSILPDEVPSHKMAIVIDASGSPQGFNLARRAVRPRGTLVLKSTYAGLTQVNLSAMVVDEITLIGSRCGPFIPALSLLESGKVDPKPLIEACYPLSEGLAAFEHAGRAGTFKILLRI